MAQIISLNKARKARAKKSCLAEAAANRARFGRTTAEKARDAARQAQLDRALDQARREPSADREG